MAQPPSPISQPSLTSIPPLPPPISTGVADPAVQRMWMETIDLMLQQPGAKAAELETIRGYIQHGITLPFTSFPPFIFHSNTSSVRQHAALVRARLHDYMEFGAVIRLSAGTVPELGIQPLHVVVKPDKKPRLVIDLSRNLNQFLKYEYFSYTTLDDAVDISFPSCWYGKLDLSNCFLSFPLHPDVQRYFVFEFEGHLYQFIRMPFGLSTAPLICTQLLSVVAFALHQYGARFSRYLDDFLFVEPTSTKLAATLQAARQVFTSFGLVVNPDKTEGPTQQITFLGIQLDSLGQTLSCTAQRVSELLSLLHPLRSQRIIRRRDCESVLGKLSFAAQVLPGARPFMRRMFDSVKRCRKRSTPVRVDPGFRADVRYWVEHLSTWNGRQQWRSARSTPIIFATDASLKGFGFYIESIPAHVDSSTWPTRLHGNTGFSGSYSPIHARFHSSHTEISWCELLAVFAAASTYAPYLQNQQVLFYVDNSTDVAIINRQATRSSRLATLLRSLFDLSLHYNFSIRALHRPGDDNQLADFLSRPSLHRNDHIHQWSLAHPSRASSLQSVSVLSSQQFLDSNGSSTSSSSSLRLPSAGTREIHTPLTTAPTCVSVDKPGSIHSDHSRRSSYAPSSSFTRQLTKLPLSPVLFPPSPIISTPTDSVLCLATTFTTQSEQDSTISTVNSIRLNASRQLLSLSSAPSAASSTSTFLKTRGIGVPTSSPSSASSELMSMPMAG